MGYSSSSVSFIILIHTSTDAESLVKIGLVVAKIFGGICRFLPSYPKRDFVTLIILLDRSSIIFAQLILETHYPGNRALRHIATGSSVKLKCLTTPIAVSLPSNIFEIGTAILQSVLERCCEMMPHHKAKVANILQYVYNLSIFLLDKEIQRHDRNNNLTKSYITKHGEL